MEVHSTQLIKSHLCPLGSSQRVWGACILRELLVAMVTVAFL